jgi:methanethiol S-methyltransferase
MAFVTAFGLFVYAVPFLADVHIGKIPLVSPTIDAGPSASTPLAVLVDCCLILLFGLQHSLMARAGFKRWLTQWVPSGLERATYVHGSNLALWPALLFWQPLPALLLDLSSLRALMTAIYLLGWLIVLLASLNIDLLELWGLRQAWSWSRGETYQPPPFKQRWLYNQVRHPLYLGLLLAFWATPHLSVGHALFASGMTAYILIGTWFEERDLVRKFGESYRAYQRSVPAYFPQFGGRRRTSPQSGRSG